MTNERNRVFITASPQDVSDAGLIGAAENVNQTKKYAIKYVPEMRSIQFDPLNAPEGRYSIEKWRLPYNANR
jgi:hypothetical protein